MAAPLNQPTVTQAERDYVAAMHRADSNQLGAAIIQQGRYDLQVRAIIDYIRNNPLPEQGAQQEGNG